MFSLTYVSSAVQLLSALELAKLLEQCVANNRRRDVTGMLLYKEGNFMQVLEGERAVVLAVHAVISRDPRHRGLMTLLQGEISERQFPDWSMGFQDLGAWSDAKPPAGYSEFLNEALNGDEFKANPSKAQKLLLCFKKVTTRY